jgi:hypothetical protein
VDFIPPNLPNTSMRLIAMAVALVGSPQSVMLEMKCSNDEFLEYCAGRKQPTQTELERLFQMITAEQGKLIAKTRELVAPQGGESRAGEMSTPNFSHQITTEPNLASSTPTGTS